jgi:hypothetical protein
MSIRLLYQTVLCTDKVSDARAGGVKCADIAENPRLFAQSTDDAASREVDKSRREPLSCLRGAAGQAHFGFRLSMFPDHGDTPWMTGNPHYAARARLRLAQDGSRYTGTLILPALPFR